MRNLLFVLSLFYICIGLEANSTIKDRLLKAKAGDFIVTEQGGNFSLLLVRRMENLRLTLEEITIDKKSVDLEKISWKKWVENRAPGASSWTGFVLDLEKNVPMKSFSFLDNEWLFVDNSKYYFSHLLSLPFQPTRDVDRKKIGPSPLPGEVDRRKFWKPQLIREGKKAKDSEYEVLRSKWPEDKTQLAGCIIEVYLDAEQPTFPFPYWLEVQHPHFTFKFPVVDSGTGIQSPAKLLK